jgi:hypothetical protein
MSTLETERLHLDNWGMDPLWARCTQALKQNFCESYTLIYIVYYDDQGTQ